MAIETNVTKGADFAKVQSIDFVNQFNGSITKLLELMGVSRKLPMTAGMTVKTYKATKDVPTTKVAEGDIIPLSKVALVVDKTHELELDKFRKSITAEAIQKTGFETAISQTDELLLKEIQKHIRSKFITALKTGTSTATATSHGLQGAIAAAWGKVQTIFEDDGVETVVFVNPEDVAGYISNANITVQSAFGMTFLTGFTGTKVIVNSGVPKGTVYATAPQNLVLAFAQVAGGELGKAFQLTTDETGLIGVTHSAEIDRATYDTVAICGSTLFAERVDGIVKVSITAPSVGG